MRNAHWDDPTLYWDDPNFYWGDPAYLLEPGDPGYTPPPGPPSVPPNRKTKNKPMSSFDYLPQSYDNLDGWLTLQPTVLTTALATTIGMTAPERTNYLAACATLKTPVANIVALMKQLEEAVADFQPLLAAQTPLIRAAIKRAKTAPTCTPAIQLQLDWVGASHEIDPTTSRPSIKAEAQPGRVKITGRKPGFEAVNLYARTKGSVTWKLIGVRKRKFPFFDESPLAVANTPEVREYRAFGTLSDEESGQPSEIVEVVFAG